MKAKGMIRTTVLVGLVLAAGWCAAAGASQVRLDAAMGTPVMLAGEKQTAYLRVAMTGPEMVNDADRTPVNVALVIDCSGSMQGAKIAAAKDAALMAVDRLRDDDFVSVVAYNATARVLVPATKVAERETIRRAIRGIQAGGSTALFAGVSKGAFETRKYLSPNRVDRVILLSDGLANVGPSSPRGSFPPGVRAVTSPSDSSCATTSPRIEAMR